MRREERKRGKEKRITEEGEERNEIEKRKRDIEDRRIREKGEKENEQRERDRNGETEIHMC